MRRTAIAVTRIAQGFVHKDIRKLSNQTIHQKNPCRPTSCIARKSYGEYVNSFHVCSADQPADQAHTKKWAYLNKYSSPPDGCSLVLIMSVDRLEGWIFLIFDYLTIINNKHRI